ncbi:hypothetical protein [Haloarchaeobius amylolyticus]|uniref:hypothetical protein n=1 Tax=Haloarchaeobius amylolyticus TaxID=1198296 RepID=UPI00226ED057|nr:hypothetical protein [Haloarchaeobius amylolyticus]
MQRRHLLQSALALSIFSAGCLGGSDCRGVALALELHAAEDVDTDSALDLDSRDLSQAERSVLTQATDERVRGCTRDDIDGLQNVVDRVAAHAGKTAELRSDMEGRFSTTVVFDRSAYVAVVVFDSAEAAGGPLGV